MKKGHQRILIFELLVFFVLCLNSFISNVLKKNLIILFLLILLVLFILIYGREKDRYRFTKFIIFKIFMIYTISFTLYYAFGFIIGFYRNSNYYTWYGLTTFIIPTILLIIEKEYLRYLILTKSEGSKLLFITTFILFIFFDITNIIPVSILTTKNGLFSFFALYFLPSISNNLAAFYITTKFGYKPNSVWLLIANLYVYLIPILPDPSEYILALIRIIFPIFLAYRIYKFYQKQNDEFIFREYNTNSIIPFLVILIFLGIVVYFTSGYFRYYAVAIASGSMEPKISRGDVVVVEKINQKFEMLEVGQTIAYDYKGIIVVHRLTKIINEDEKYYFFTKGDANASEDAYVIYEDMIIGIAKIKIPYIGYPTIWLSEL